MAEWIAIYTSHVEQQAKPNKSKKTTSTFMPLKLTVSRSLELMSKIPLLERALQIDVDDILVSLVFMRNIHF